MTSARISYLKNIENKRVQNDEASPTSSEASQSYVQSSLSSIISSADPIVSKKSEINLTFISQILAESLNKKSTKRSQSILLCCVLKYISITYLNF
jgi:hypothetical protein